MVLKQDRIGIIAQSFEERGFGLVLLCAFTDTDFKVRCFSTVCKENIYAILERVATNASSLEFDDADIMNGRHIVRSDNEALNERAQWAADYLERDEPMIIAAVGKEHFSAFAVGDAPMITYTAVRMLTTLRQEGDINLDPFQPNMN